MRPLKKNTHARAKKKFSIQTHTRNACEKIDTYNEVHVECIIYIYSM
jgi:hypothetical protein